MSDRPPVVSSNDNRVDGLVRRSFDPALTIDVNSLAMPRTFAVYILASLSRRLYVGVTGDLLSRLHEHRTALRRAMVNDLGNLPDWSPAVAEQIQLF